MPTYAHKILGQSAPLLNTDTDIYTVPALTEAVLAALTVCNRGTGATTYRVAIRPDGAALANLHYIVFDVPIIAYDTHILNLGVAINAGDVVMVRAAGNCSFALSGTEVTA